jgi:hypothetical protein
VPYYHVVFTLPAAIAYLAKTGAKTEQHMPEVMAATRRPSAKF